MSIDSLDPNLLTHTKKPAQEKDQVAAPRFSRRYRRIIKYISYAIIFLLSFAVFLVLKLPDTLVTNFILTRLNQSSPYRFQADKVSLHFFLLPHIQFDKLTLDPTMPGQGFSLALDKASIYPNPISLINFSGPPKIKGSFSAEAYKANFSGGVGFGSDIDIQLSADKIDLAKFTPLVEMGADAKGIIKNSDIRLILENQKFSKADGEINITGQDLIIDPASFNAPIPLPILDLGPLEIQAKAVKGKLHIDKFQLGNPAKDLFVKIEGDIQLSDPVQFSRMELKIKFKPSEKIRKAIPALDGMLAYIAAKRTDGFFGTKISGSIQTMGVPTPDP